LPARGLILTLFRKIRSSALVRDMAPPKSARPIFTYRTRLVLTPAQDAALGAWAELMGRAERRLFALREAEARGRPVPTEVGPDGKVRPIPLKRRIMEKVALTGRQFNAVERQLEARVASIEERRKGLIEDSGQRRARGQAGGEAHPRAAGLQHAPPKAAPAGDARGAARGPDRGRRRGSRPALFRLEASFPGAGRPSRERLHLSGRGARRLAGRAL
jgi:hypothetical protein